MPATLPGADAELPTASSALPRPPLSARPDPDRMARLIGFADRGIILADAALCIVEVNPHALAVYGYDHDEIVGMPLRELFGDDAGYREALDKADRLRGGVFHACHRRKDGRLFPVEIGLSTLALDGSTYRQAVIRDLAERAHAEDSLRRMNRTLTALAQCNEVLAYGESEEEILTEICRVVVDAGYRFVWIGYAEQDEARTVRPVARYGHEEDDLDKHHITWADTGNGADVTGAAIRQGRPSCLRNESCRGHAACLALPLTLDGAVIGALTVHATRPDAFDDDEIRLLEELAGKLSWGISIQRHRAGLDAAAAALRASEERYHTLVRMAPAGIFRTDAAGHPIYVSRRWCELAGMTPLETAGDGWLRAIHPDDRDQVMEQWRHCLAERAEFEAEYRMCRPDGASTWVSCSAKPETDGSGTLVGYVGAVQDISRIKRLEDQLRQALHDEQTAAGQLQATMASLSNAQRIAAFGNWDWDLTTGVTWWSDGVYRLFGMGRTEPAPTVDGLMQVIHPADRFRVWESFQTALTMGAPLDIDYRVVWPNGETRVLHSVGETSFDEDGSPVRMSGVIQDVTAQRMAEAQISRLSSVVAQTPLSILITDTDGLIEYVNPFFEQLMGYTLDEVRGKSPRVLKSGAQGPEVYKGLWSTIMAGETWRGELLNQTKDGRQLWQSVTIAALRDASGSIVNLVGIEEDITERKRSEERLAKAMDDLHRSNRDLEQFAYVVSHDLREPLRTVTNFMGLLERRLSGQLDETAQEFFNFVKSGAKRMDRMIVALLDYSRIGRKGAPLAPMAIGPVIDRAIANLDAAISDSGARIHVGAGMPVACIDENEITRLFQNLIGNAIKYRAPDTVPEIRISVHRDGGHWVFDVADNGIGIDPKHFDRIFGVFQRLHTQEHYEGTGIGLAVCRRIVERHGGRIWLDSTPGAGSTFHIALPAPS